MSLTLLALLSPACTLIPYDDAFYDADRDGLEWYEDCDDEDRSVRSERTWYPDEDGDGLGNADGAIGPMCFPPSDSYVGKAGDCDDQDPEVGVLSWYADTDGDSFGDPEVVQEGCEPPEETEASRWVANDQDCDDTNPDASPDHAELCDGTDNNCDGVVDEESAVDAILWYPDSDRDGWGDDFAEDSALIVACESPGIAYTDRGGDCEDTLPEVNPEAAELCGNGLDDDCDGDYEPECGVGTGDSPLLNAGARIYGEAGDLVGWSGTLLESVSEGDATPDLLIGAYGGSGAGLYLVHGPVTGSSSVSDGALDILAIRSQDAGDLLGWSVSRADDLDGDGVDDLAMGAPGHEGNRGGVFILSGPVGTGEVFTSELIELIGSSSGDFAGYALAGAGSLSSDAAPDLLIGAPFYGIGNTGAAYLVHGPISASPSDLGEVGDRLRGEADGDWAGSAVSSAGDVDGDGLEDLLVGAPLHDSDATTTDCGAAYLLLAPISGSVALADANLKLLGEAAYDEAGSQVRAGGQIFQFLEFSILVGAPTGLDLDGERSGRSYILSHQTLLDHLPQGEPVSLANADTVFIGDAENDAASTITDAGDLDGDGRDDVAIGAPNAGRGKVYVWYGHSTLKGQYDLVDAAAVLIGERTGDSAGFTLSGGVDMNLDGNDDLLVGAWGYDGPGSSLADAGAIYLVTGGPGP